eukprot:scaffold60_cov137-Skeletonema_marinoi.AAC.6
MSLWHKFMQHQHQNNTLTSSIVIVTIHPQTKKKKKHHEVLHLCLTTATAIIAFFGAPVSSKKRYTKSGSGDPLCLWSLTAISNQLTLKGVTRPGPARLSLSSVIHHLPGWTAPITCVKNFTKTDEYDAYQSTSEGVLNGESMDMDLGSDHFKESPMATLFP